MARTSIPLVKTIVRAALALLLGGLGAYAAGAATEPGGAVIAGLLMLGAIRLGVTAVQHWRPVLVPRGAMAVGVLVAGATAFLLYDVAEPLFARSQDVPSVVASAPLPAWAAAVERARPAVRAAILQENLPGVSIAVGAGGDVVWAEGFGWRDVGTGASVTPATRFNIGTAASMVTTGTVVSLGLADTGAETASVWSPEAIGEEGEDFPLFTLVRHGVLQPLGLAPSEYPLPGERATFYVPRSGDNDPRNGRRLMYMRDLACCADGMASYSTPSDLVRVALATGAGSVDGELAGGPVVSLVVSDGDGIVVAVASNVAYADTAALAREVAGLFAARD
jgi:hypothetical protein